MEADRRGRGRDIADDGSDQKQGNPWRTGVFAVLGLLLIAGIATAAVLLLGGDEASGQTIEFQQPDEAGADPFTPAADVTGETTVKTSPSSSSSSEPSSGAGTFGGSGSNVVCDREKLIRELLARPDRMRAWAGVLGVEPTAAAVKRYIRGLRPVTLTRDTQVTNHAYRNGRIVSFQSILAAGTAVLVDKYGKPVVRCRCGNPLTEPVFYKKATCHNCPPHYRPPPPCKWRPYDPYDEEYARDPYTGEYVESPPETVEYEKNPYSDCYVYYPNPPKTSNFSKLPQAETSSPDYSPPAPTYTPHTQTYTNPCHDPYGCGEETPPPEEPDHNGVDCSDPNTYCDPAP
jgi:hypothetical protein